MAESMVQVGGTRVFVDDRGDGPTTLLYVHGGPGQGAYDFMAAVGDRLAEHVRVVGVDQRGCLRSDPLPDGAPLTHELLISDFEELRAQLGIAQWAVMGHSAGGPLALKYALAHPDAVGAALFLCATFDCDLTDRFRLPVAADLLRQRGKEAAADRCEKFVRLPGPLTAEDKTYLAMQELGEAYMDLFMHDADGVAAYWKLWAAGGFSDAEETRGMSHLPLVSAMYEPTLDLLPRLTQPHAVIHGVDDLVTSPDQIEVYQRTTNEPRVVTLPRTGHFPFIEQPDEFVAALLPLL